MAGTAYVVFVEDQSGDLVSWLPVRSLGAGGVYVAVSADAAIRAAAVEHGAATYAATPVRSWQQRTVKVEAKASFA